MTATVTPETAELIDALLGKLTAVPSLAALREMQLGGYVPTVHPTTRRRAQLVRLLRAAGVRVWTGVYDAR